MTTIRRLALDGDAALRRVGSNPIPDEVLANLVDFTAPWMAVHYKAVRRFVAKAKKRRTQPPTNPQPTP